MSATSATETFREARDFLLEHREDYERAYAGFRWPRADHFNWALDWFDVIAEGNDRTALHIVEEDGRRTEVSFAAMSERSARAANWLKAQGVREGDRILVMLGNQVELWETALAAMKLRAVVIPATPLLGPADLRDRVERGRVRHVLVRDADTAKFDEVPGRYTRIAVGDEVAGWRSYAGAAEASAVFTPGPGDRRRRAADALLHLRHHRQPRAGRAHPCVVPRGPLGDDVLDRPPARRRAPEHLLARLGQARLVQPLRPLDRRGHRLHLQLHAFDPNRLMAEMDRSGITSFCAPPTVWRMLIQADLSQLKVPPREVVAAGEPLNPEVIETVRRVWGVTIRDGFGQTETAVQVANSPGQLLKTGSMGRPSPGFTVELLDPVTGQPGASEGEISLDLADRPVGLMTGYHGDPDRTAEAMAGGYYRTGDIGARDEDGYITYVGRADDVFKASDYKISPFELESALLEHEAVAEAAVVPAPDPLRLAVPKAYIVLAEGWEPGPDTAKVLFAHSRAVLAPYKRLRKLEFAELPKTVSGKIRRIELRERTALGGGVEFDEGDLK
ncbi:AMP-binding protein [Streptomyces californicus]